MTNNNKKHFMWKITTTNNDKVYKIVAPSNFSAMQQLQKMLTGRGEKAARIDTVTKLYAY